MTTMVTLYSYWKTKREDPQGHKHVSLQ